MQDADWRAVRERADEEVAASPWHVAVLDRDDDHPHDNIFATEREARAYAARFTARGIGAIVFQQKRGASTMSSNAIETTIRDIEEAREREGVIEVGQRHGRWFARLPYGHEAWGPTLEHALASLRAHEQVERAERLEHKAKLKASDAKRVESEQRIAGAA